MSFLLYECRYCLTECWPFDKESWSFLRFKNLHWFACLHKNNILEISNKIDWKAPGSTLHVFMSKATVIICLTLWDVLKMFLGGLWKVFSSPIITLNFQRGMRVIQPVTSLGCFGRAKMAANFALNQPTSNGWKSSVHLPYAKKKSMQCFQVRLKLYY